MRCLIQKINLSNVELPIPEGFEIVSTEELQELRESADLRRWWNLEEVIKRYHRKRAWILKVFI